MFDFALTQEAAEVDMSATFPAMVLHCIKRTQQLVKSSAHVK